MQAMRRAARPLAAGEPAVSCRQFAPTVSRAARPSAVSELVGAVEQRYVLTLRTSEAKADTASEGGSVLNAKAQRGRVEQAPDPSIERTCSSGLRPLPHARMSNVRLHSSTSTKRRSILVVLALPGLALGQEQTLVFAGGKVEVVLPSGVRVISNEKQTLVAVFGPDADHKLELTLHEELQSAIPVDAAEQFVRDQAQKKGRKLQQGPGKSLFMELGGEFMQEGKPHKSLHVQVGFGKSLVVITLTAPRTMSTALNQFLGGPINVMVASLRRREA
jgi:hypothetical protein